MLQRRFDVAIRRRYPTLLWSCHIVGVETSDDIANTTSLQRLIMTSLYETLKRRRFCNVGPLFHHNYMATSERRWIATSQQRCNDVFVSTRNVSINSQNDGHVCLNMVEKRVCHPSKLLFVRGSSFKTRLCIFHNSAAFVDPSQLSNVISLKIIKNRVLINTTMVTKFIES